MVRLLVVSKDAITLGQLAGYFCIKGLLPYTSDLSKSIFGSTYDYSLINLIMNRGWGVVFVKLLAEVELG